MIIYITSKLRKVCNEKKKAVRDLGQEMADLLHLRLEQLRGFNYLAEVPHTRPLRRHMLGGNRKGQFSVDLVHPFRLIFIPANDPIPLKTDGGYDLTRITEIEIIEIGDTH